MWLDPTPDEEMKGRLISLSSVKERSLFDRSDASLIL